MRTQKKVNKTDHSDNKAKTVCKNNQTQTLHEESPEWKPKIIRQPFTTTKKLKTNEYHLLPGSVRTETEQNVVEETPQSRGGSFTAIKKRNKVERNFHTLSGQICVSCHRMLKRQQTGLKLRIIKITSHQGQKNYRGVNNRKVSKKEMKHCDKEKTLG